MGVTEWKELKSKKGTSYEVGRESTTGPGTTKPEDVTTGNADDFGMGVDWKVTDDQPPPLITTSPTESQKTGITDYKISNSRKTGYQYDLQFKPVWTGKESYSFHDESGDSYECPTTQPNTYFVSYNSNYPAILYITGSAT